MASFLSMGKMLLGSTVAGTLKALMPDAQIGGGGFSNRTLEQSIDKFNEDHPKLAIAANGAARFLKGDRGSLFTGLFDKAPKVSHGFRTTRRNSNIDAVKAIQDQTDENTKNINTVSKDLNSAYTFLHSEVTKIVTAVDILHKRTLEVVNATRNNADDIALLKARMSNMSRHISKLESAADAATDAPKDPVTAASGGAGPGGDGGHDALDTAKEIGAWELAKKAGRKLLSGAARLLTSKTFGVAATVGAGAYALSKSDENKQANRQTRYEDNLKKHGKDKADVLDRVQNEGTLSRLKRFITGDSFASLPDSAADARKVKAKEPGEVNPETGQQNPGFFRRMLEGAGSAASAVGGIFSGGGATNYNPKVGGGGYGGAGASGSYDSSGPSRFGGAAKGGERYPQMAEMRAAMIDQGMKAGLTREQAELHANGLGGQAISESGLVSQFHDAGKRLGEAGGYVKSIYGADRSRGQAMMKWMKDNGLDPNSTVDQGRWMVHESLTKFPNIRKSAEHLTKENAGEHYNRLTTEYEAPASRYDPRTQQERRNNAETFSKAPIKDVVPAAAGGAGPDAVKTSDGKPAVPAGYKLGEGRLAGHIDASGKLSAMATDGFGPIKGARASIMADPAFKSFPKELQDHIKNSPQIDMNFVAKFQDKIPQAMKDGLAKEGLTFTPAQPAVPGVSAAVDASPKPSNDNRVVETQQKVAATRKGEISSELRNQLNYAGRQTGVYAEVYSGGQRMPGAHGAVGSHRHDGGGAADLKLYELDENGKKRFLDQRNPADAAKMHDFIKHSVAAGANGVGFGANYMGTGSLHIGGGSEASWSPGSSREDRNWVEGARLSGMDARQTYDPNAAAVRQLTEKERGALTEQAAASPNWPTTVAPPPDAKPDDRSWWQRAKDKVASAYDYVTGAPKKEDAAAVQPAIPNLPDSLAKQNDNLPGQGGTIQGADPVAAPVDGSVFDKGAAPVAGTNGPQQQAASSGPTSVASSDGIKGRGGGGMRSPTNNPEQRASEPGSDGYGEKHDPDFIGICSV